MDNTLEFRVAGAVIRGRPSASQVAGGSISGLYFKPGGLQGWDDLTDSRRQATARPVSQGEFDTRVYRGARVITCDGLAIAYNMRELSELGDIVRGIGWEGDRVRLSVEHQGRTLHANARRLSVDFPDRGYRDGPRLCADFQLQFLCADPRRYGETTRLAAASSHVLSHLGNVISYPIVEVASAPPSYTLTHPQGSFVVSGAPSGTLHRIDMKTKRLTSNGSRVWGAASGSPLVIPPGRRVSASISTGTFRPIVTDTFG